MQDGQARTTEISELALTPHLRHVFGFGPIAYRAFGVLSWRIWFVFALEIRTEVGSRAQARGVAGRSNLPGARVSENAAADGRQDPWSTIIVFALFRYPGSRWAVQVALATCATV